jgi:hypothetical protein
MLIFRRSASSTIFAFCCRIEQLTVDGSLEKTRSPVSGEGDDELLGFHEMPGADISGLPCVSGQGIGLLESYGNQLRARQTGQGERTGKDRALPYLQVL